jgi:hypothetical protein
MTTPDGARTRGAIDAPLLELTADVPPRPLPAELAQAREDALAAATDLRALPEAGLDESWIWPGHGEVELRYAAYRVGERFEQAEVDARAALAADATGSPDDGLAARRIAPVTAARWDLRGLLLRVDAAMFDAEQAPGEWSIRLTLGHVINGQRAYGWGTAWWQAKGYALDDPGLPASAPDAFWAALPDEAVEEVAGSREDVIERLDTIVDQATERLAGLPRERLALGGRWSGLPVSLEFRLARWSSHVREHTIQVEKSLAWLGAQPTEPDRLARLALAGYGLAESTVFGRASSVALERAVGIVVAAAREARELAADARRSASPGR